jgi:hypothetical protein
MAENNNAEKMFDTLTTWMDSADAMNLTELRQVRRAMGDDVEKSERGFLAHLAKLKAENPIPEAQRIEGLLVIAKRLGLDVTGLANKTGLSVVLITKLDRRLIRPLSVPQRVCRLLEEALNTAVELVVEYLQQSPMLATEASFRAKENPRIQEQQDFFEAVRSDRSVSEERRSALLALEEQQPPR